MLGYAAVSVAATIIETILSANISTRFGKRLRGEVFSYAVAFSDRDAGSFSAGSLLTRTTNDVQQVVSAMVLGLRLGVGAPLMAVMAIIRIAQSSGELTIATGVAGFILLAGIMAILMVVLPRFKLIQKLTADWTALRAIPWAESASSEPIMRRRTKGNALRTWTKSLRKTISSRAEWRQSWIRSCSSYTTDWRSLSIGWGALSSCEITTRRSSRRCFHLHSLRRRLSRRSWCLWCSLICCFRRVVKILFAVYIMQNLVKIACLWCIFFIFYA